MNYDAQKLAELREQAQHNRRQEEIESVKATAAKHAALAKLADSAIKGATGLAGMLGGKNDVDWGVTGQEQFDRVFDQSYVQLLLSSTETPVAINQYAPVMVNNFYPVLGDTVGQGVSPMYLAFKRIYDIIRDANRGATNYTVPNVIQYLLPPISIAVQLSYFELLLRLSENPDVSKRVSLIAIFDILGINYSEFLKGKPAIQDRIVRLKGILDQFPVPIDLPVLKRWIWLTSFAFLDGEGANASIFINRPLIYYSTNTATPETILVPKSANIPNAVIGDEFGVDEFMQDFTSYEEELNRILSDKTLQAVAGDIINAFKKSLVNWTNLDLNVKESPYYYDEEYCLELTNMRIGGNIAAETYGALALKYTKTGGITQHTLNSLGEAQNLYIDVPSKVGTLGLNGDYAQVICTDGHDTLDRGTTSMAEAWMQVCGSPTSSVVVYYWDPENEGQLLNHTVTAATRRTLIPIDSYSTEIFVRSAVYGVSTAGAVSALLELECNLIDSLADMVALNSFDHFPWRVADANNKPYFICTDMDHYGVISKPALRNSHIIRNQCLWGYRSVTRVDFKDSSDKFNKRNLSKNKNKDKDKPKE